MTAPKTAAERSATFGEVFAVPEFRVLYSASALSWVGDYLARAAVTALVFTVSNSVFLSAASFAIGYLPGLTFGPPLAALAERYPHRRVMITCDVARAALISLVAIPNLPVPAILLLLFATASLSPAFDASRSSLLPRILDGDLYVVGLAAQTTTTNIATIFGYVVGGALAPFHPHLALLIDAGTFLGSAVILAGGIKPRAVIASTLRRGHLIGETVAGFRLVLQSPVLRPIAAIVFFGAMFAVVPEGLAAAWAADLSHGGSARGYNQALIMAATPVGAVIGAVVIGRMVSPAWRQRLVRPLAVLVPAALVPVFLVHSVELIATLSLISSFAVNGLAAPANGMFVRATPAEFRARAFGVVQFSFQLSQALALVITGLVAGYVAVPTSVAIFSALGVCAMVAVSATWPSMQRIDETIAAVQTHNEAAIAAAEEAADAAAEAVAVASGRHRRTEPSTGPAPRQAGPTDEHHAGLSRHDDPRHDDPESPRTGTGRHSGDRASTAEPPVPVGGSTGASRIAAASTDEHRHAALGTDDVSEPAATTGRGGTDDSARVNPSRAAGSAPQREPGMRAEGTPVADARTPAVDAAAAGHGQRLAPRQAARPTVNGYATSRYSQSGRASGSSAGA